MRTSSIEYCHQQQLQQERTFQQGIRRRLVTLMRLRSIVALNMNHSLVRFSSRIFQLDKECMLQSLLESTYHIRKDQSIDHQRLYRSVQRRSLSKR
jgi:hypothetical protein